MPQPRSEGQFTLDMAHAPAAPHALRVGGDVRTRGSVAPPSVATTLVVCALLLSPVLGYRMGVDQGLYAYMGAEILEGRWPYVDTWDHNFPGAMFLQALQILVLGKSIAMFRLFDFVYQLANAALVYLIAARVGGRAGAYLGAALFVLTYQAYGPWNTGQREGFALLFVLAGYWLFLTAERRPLPLTAAGIGFGLGLGLTIKPTLLAFAAIYLPLLPRVRRSHVLPVAAGVLALFVPILGFLAFYWTIGGLREFYDATIAFQMDVYVQRLRGDESLLLFWLAKLRRMGANALAVAVVYPGFLFFGPARRERLMLYIGYLAALLTVFVQGTFAGYHYLVGLGLGAILIGTMFSMTVGRLLRGRFITVGRYRVRAVAVAAHLLIVAAIPFYVRGAAVERLISGQFLGPPVPGEFRNDGVFDFTESYQVAEYVRTRTSPTDRIQVWGHESLVYYLAERDAASRFQATTALVMQTPDGTYSPLQESWRREFVDAIGDQRPPYVAVVTGDHWWWTPGERTSEELLEEFPAWSALLSRDYRLERTIGRFEIYRRVEAGGDAR